MKKMFSLLCALLLTVSLVGCGLAGSREVEIEPDENLTPEEKKAREEMANQMRQMMEQQQEMMKEAMENAQQRQGQGQN
jgi:predicted small lipoprotein YifL